MENSRYPPEKEAKLIADQERFQNMAFILNGMKPYADFGSPLPNTVPVGGKEDESPVLDKKCCPCHGKGCEIAHDAPRFAMTINEETGNEALVKVFEDTGTPANWVTLQYAMSLDVEVQSITSNTEFFDFGGKNHRPTKIAWITLTGFGDRAHRAAFYIAPENAPLDGVIVGTKFIRQYGHAHWIFSEGARDPAFLMVQKKETIAERKMIDASRAESAKGAQMLSQTRNQRGPREPGPRRGRGSPLTASVTGSSSSRRKQDQAEPRKAFY